MICMKYYLERDGLDGYAYYVSFPVIGEDGTIYVIVNPNISSETSTAYLYAVNPDGTLKWVIKKQGGYPRFLGNPVLSKEGFVYISYYYSYFNQRESYIYKIAADGKTLDAIDLNELVGGGVAEHIIISDDNNIFVNLVASGSVSTLIAFDQNWNIKWTQKPVLNNIRNMAYDSSSGIIYIAMASLMAIKNDGTILWKRENINDKFTYFGHIVVGKNGMIYVTNDNPWYDHSAIFAITSENQIKWVFSVDGLNDLTKVSYPFDWKRQYHFF